MSIKNRLAKLEKELLPYDDKNFELVICEAEETRDQACQRLNIDLDDGMHRMFILFE